jgi:hypothetical protein
MQKYTGLLVDLYHEIFGPTVTMANLNELAADLSRIAGRTQPWTGKFLHSLIKGYSGFTINDQLVEALHVLASRHDGVDEIQTLASKATVLAVNQLPAGTVVLGRARRCATPGCQVLFVPTHPRQKYHSKVCAETGRRHRKRNMRQAA